MVYVVFSIRLPKELFNVDSSFELHTTTQRFGGTEDDTDKNYKRSFLGFSRASKDERQKTGSRLARALWLYADTGFNLLDA